MRWIPCVERQPEDGQVVILCTGYGSIKVAERHKMCCRHEWTVHMTGFNKAIDDNEVVAWMPLPQPYKETKDEII